MKGGMATTSATSVDLSTAGLASGMDWKTMVSQLADVERAPEKLLQSQQSTINQQNTAFGNLSAELSTLKNNISNLQDTSIYGKRTATPSDATLASAIAATSTAPGTYAFKINQLATASVQSGTANVSNTLNPTDQVSGVVLGTAGLSTDITAGTFSINGQRITVATTDTLQSVFDQIVSATGGAVTAGYDPTSDKITLSSASEIVLGSATDTSNILQALKLSNSGTGTVTSSTALGGAKQSGNMTQANLSTPIQDVGENGGQFSINGVGIAYSSNESISTVLARITDSAAGVSAAFDSTKNQFVLTSKATGDIGISMQDVSGNFLQATGLSSGTLQHGKDLLYTLNNGGQLSSHSNTITDSTSGVTGLSVTALSQNSFTVTVAADTSAVSQAINDFVTEYNKVQSMLASYTATTTSSTGTVTAGILAAGGDAADIASSLRTLTYSPVVNTGVAVTSLDDLGITTNGKDNTLSISNNQKLSDALANNLSLVQDLFTNSTKGIATKLSTLMDNTIGANGSLMAKQASLTKQSNDINTQVANMERTVQADSDRLTNEFVAMETAQQAAKTQLQIP